MFNRLRSLILRALRVRADPTPPAGAAGSVRVFRAGVNLYRLRLMGWAIGQLLALGGIILSFSFLAVLKQEARIADAQPPRSSAATPGGNRALRPAVAFVRSTPAYTLTALTFVEVVGCAFYLAQLLFTYGALRLDYELRWYIVTDRSLRIRTGLVSVQEITMSFANIQQVVVTRGPLQSVLGIGDVRVQTAGGGSAGEHAHGETGPNLHVGIFGGVNNATEIRDLILERLRQFRASGLGDPDDHIESPPHQATIAEVPTLLPPAQGAANEVLGEVRELRRVLTTG